MRTGKYYSNAVPHREISGAYWGSFGIPGEKPAWVLENNRQKIFSCPLEAELAGFHAMMAKLNSVKPERQIRIKPVELDSSRVFEKFK